MQINRERQNIETIRVTLEEKEVHRILIAAVAEKAGVSLDAARARAYHWGNDTSTGYKHDFKVEIVIDQDSPS